MGELILCREPIAANPFFLEDASLNIYSLEELSYYISNNVYLLNADFISVDLCRWIGRELGAKALEEQLMTSMQELAPLHVFVGQILTYNGYLTNQEIRTLLQTIVSFENKSPVECKKMRADRLMEKDKLVDAIFEYESLIDGGELAAGSTEFEGDVWHNLGSAYARLFFFGEASLCFEEAYKRNHKQQSMRLMLAALRCNKDDKRFSELVERYFIPTDVVESIKEEVTALSAKESVRSFDGQVDRMVLSGEPNHACEEEIDQIIEGWKVQYNHLCSM